MLNSILIITRNLKLGTRSSHSLFLLHSSTLQLFHGVKTPTPILLGTRNLKLTFPASSFLISAFQISFIINFHYIPHLIQIIKICHNKFSAHRHLFFENFYIDKSAFFNNFSHFINNKI